MSVIWPLGIHVKRRKVRLRDCLNQCSWCFCEEWIFVIILANHILRCAYTAESILRMLGINCEVKNLIMQAMLHIVGVCWMTQTYDTNILSSAYEFLWTSSCCVICFYCARVYLGLTLKFFAYNQALAWCGMLDSRYDLKLQCIGVSKTGREMLALWETNTRPLTFNLCDVLSFFFVETRFYRHEVFNSMLLLVWVSSVSLVCFRGNSSFIF